MATLCSRREFLRGVAGSAVVVAGLNSRRVHAASDAERPPNIVYILADDLGYGDVSCLNEASKINTPNIDRLARQGVVFTDAHSPSAVCTPTRYGILTGRYPWRTRLKQGVLYGYSEHLVDPGRLTVPKLLKQHGYHSGCVGKWHLGWDWALKEGESEPNEKTVDFARPIRNGPTTMGFDYFYGIAASLDMPPYVYVENDRCVGLPDEHFPGLKGQAFQRPGPAQEGFEARDVLPTLTRQAVAYIERRAAADAKQPFLLYLPLNAPHTPIVPTDEFKGKSGVGEYGDFVVQVDWTVGQVLDALDRHGLAENTLVVFTSDNGCSPMAGFKEIADVGHHPSYHFRGHKADIFEGGHRIPFVARWPGQVRAGAISSETTCLTDLMATAAAAVGADLPDDAGEDSYSMLPVLLGKGLAGPVREATVHESINGSLSIRQGKWKLELCPGSGGWSAPRPKQARELGLPPVQLYDLTQDVGEKENVHDQHPEVVKRLTALLDRYVAQGRSTPGAPQQNEGPTSIWGPQGRKTG